ncbi:hypothetical protein SAY86_028254 [Trapa natans]|uniref:Rad21/Rec8-like protein N-terminal domain-containing protein n=1 Tax=Trapa natans TaxID=22666 RepID=A0AAN7LUD4_TRANT|nr:hypothetical protein SAY86_028254 [Trapa natans]
MFYSQFILAKKGPLGTIWIAAHLERKIRKNQVADTDIGVSVDSIIFPNVPIALRLSSHLLLGVVRIYSRKVNYLFDDCSETLLKDTMEVVVYSTSQFAPDEQFGDGDTGQICLDLGEEEALLGSTSTPMIDEAYDDDPQPSLHPMTPFEADDNDDGFVTDSSKTMLDLLQWRSDSSSSAEALLVYLLFHVA